MTKQEYIQSNKVLRKAFTNLDKKDLLFLQQVVENKIDVHDPKYHMYYKQVIFHMANGLNIWELHQLKKSFTILMNLK